MAIAHASDHGVNVGSPVVALAVAIVPVGPNHGEHPSAKIGPRLVVELGRFVERRHSPLLSHPVVCLVLLLLQ